MVSHTLSAEVYFSIVGEDAAGRSMGRPIAGGLRVLKLTRPIVLPSCGIIPAVLDLPTYDATRTAIGLRSATVASNGGAYKELTAAPCSLCGSTVEDMLCRTCTSSSVPHMRHDHNPKLVGDPRGVCPVCEKTTYPTTGPGWWQCACGVNIEDAEKRMREGLRPEEPEEDWERRKEEAERGRPTELPRNAM